MKFKNYPRIPLGLYPTPLQSLEKLSQSLGGPRIWMKRDDLCGIAFGGNKIRKLEYVLHDVKESGYDTVVTAGGPQSNHTLLTAASASKLGLDYRIIALSAKPEKNTGNLVAHHVYNSKIIFKEVDASEGWGKTALKIYMDIKKDLEKQNRKPVFIPVGASTPLGALGYCRCIYELKEQAFDNGFEPTHFVLTCGSMGTVTGILLGKKLFNMNFKVNGISVFPEGEYLRLGLDSIEKNVSEAGKFLDTEVDCSPEDYEIFYDYTGPEYGSVTPECMEAIKVTARTEGIILGPVYSAKSMAGLMDLIKKGYFEKSDNVVYLHTGGTPEIFAKYDKMTEFLNDK